MKINLTDHTPAEIAEALDIAPFQGAQIFRWLHTKQVFDLEAMTDLSKALRQRIAEECVVRQLEAVDESFSDETGTRKLLYRLADGETVESVLLRSRDRITLCLSTQVGCAVRCAFCATGLSGFTRNLNPGEIVEQALHLLSGEELEGRTPNIVFMGMGEPLRNYDAVMKSIRLLMDKRGLGIGARKITVSTAGDVPGIDRFSDEDWQVRLSVSLHAANNAKRSALVPLNRKYPVEKLMEALRRYLARTGRQITFEWTLLQGVNDSLTDAKELLGLARTVKASVNLIPYNPVSGTAFATSTSAACNAFCDYLVDAGIKATLRQERGRDIDAACGQLRRRNTELAH